MSRRPCIDDNIIEYRMHTLRNGELDEEDDEQRSCWTGGAATRARTSNFQNHIKTGIFWTTRFVSASSSVAFLGDATVFLLVSTYYYLARNEECCPIQPPLAPLSRLDPGLQGFAFAVRSY